MSDKARLEALRQKIRESKSTGTADGKVAPTRDAVERTRKKLEALKSQKSSTKPAAAANPPAAPLPRVKGDARPVEPVSGVSAVSSEPVAPASGVPTLGTKKPTGFSELFSYAKNSLAQGTLTEDVAGLIGEGASKIASAASTGAQRSIATAGRDYESGKLLAGAGDANAWIEANREIDKIKYEADLDARLKDFAADKTFSGKAGKLLSQPDLLTAFMSEQVANIGVSLGMGGGGAVAGSVVPGVGSAAGFVAGTMASGAVTKATEVVTEFMQEQKGIDLDNEEQVRGFFENPEALSELRAYSAKAGVVLGLVDGLVALIGAKGVGSKIAEPFVKPFIKPVETMVDGKLVSKVMPGAVAEAAGAFALETGGAAASEIASQLASRGSINAADVYDEVLLGTAANLGQASIATIISRGEKSGRAPTAEEIANAGGMGVDPADVFVSPEEAQAAGRTLFGFVENGKSEPVTLGTYDDAEAVAGAGDIRRGRFIAVKEDQATPPVTTEEVIQAVDATNSQALADIKTRLQSFGAAGVKAAQYVQAAVNTYDNSVYVQKSDPTASKEQLQVTIETALKPLRTYKGDVKGLGVTPAARNELAYADVQTSPMGKTVFNTEYSTGAPKVLNLDALQTKLKEKNWKIIPSNIKSVIGTLPRMQKLLDSTFTFATPAARQNFIDGDIAVRTALMKSGEVSWTGKLDNRFLHSSSSAAYHDREFAILDETGNALPFAEVQNVIASATSAIKPEQQTRREQRRDRTSVKVSNDAAHAQEFAAQGLTAAGDFKSFTLIPQSEFVPLMKKWVAKFKISRPVIYVEFGRDPTGSTVFPLAFQNQFPSVYQRAKSQGDGFSGMLMTIGDIGYVSIVESSSPKITPKTYRIFAHEFGHMISSDSLFAAPLEVRNKIFAAYRRFIVANPLTAQKYAQYKRRWFADVPPWQKLQDIEADKVYYLSFEEWFAEQTARWAQTNGRPLGMVAKFFRNLAKKLIEMMKDLRKAEGKLESRAELEMDQYLSAVWDGADVLTNWPSEVIKYTEAQARKQNAKSDPDPLSQHGSTSNVSAALNSALKQPFLPEDTKSLLNSVRAGVDRYNWFYEWGLNLRQLAARNPHIQELQLFNELLDFAKNDATKIMVEAEGYLKRWRKRSSTQQKALTNLLFAMNDMSYLQPGEQPRWPTPQEFAALVQQTQIDADTLVLYRDIRDFFLNSVRRQEELQLQEAARITDPGLRQAAITSAQDMSRMLISRPYFPQMRFGKWSLTIRNGNSGKLEHFELFESKRDLQRALDDAVRQYPESAGWEVNGSTIPQEVQPFIGVPPWMLDKLRDMPGLTKVQQDWMEQFRYLLAPAQSFRKRMLRRDGYKGYATDGRRVFANYAFHHARFYSRIKHDWDLRNALDGLYNSRNPNDGPNEISIRKEMGDFVDRIYKEFRNPSQDWAQLRVLNAIWHLGFVPASAIINLTQTVLATAPYLSAKFGNVKGEAALTNAARKLSTYYKQGSYKSMPDSEFKAIAKAVEEGFIDESMAAELAASAVGSGTGLKVGSTFVREKLAIGWQQFSEKSMWMFRMAEQWNRRVSFRAARQLAFDNPNVQWVQDMRIKHFLKYDQLIKSGWTDREALAYLAGIETLLETHYSYDRLARPRFMQGRKSVLFAFYMFTQNSLFMLWNNKDMLARYMLYMAIIAGPMGLVPDDAEDLLNAIGSKLFGKDFNLEREARKLIVDLLDDESSVPPDMLLHGISRYSFGMSKVADFLGAKFVPDIDLSKNVTLNRVLPVNVTSLLKPGVDWNDRIANMTRDAAGAAYGIPYAIGKAVAGSDLNLLDFKRWEGAMPRVFRQLSRAGRLAYEGGERDTNGNRTIPYDYEDPKQLAELVAIANGFTPTKQSQFWDRAMAEKEMDVFWKAQKEILYEELYNAKFTYQDNEAFRAAVDKVKEFNKRAPKGYQITGDAVKNSLTRRQKTRVQIERGENPYVGKGVAEEGAKLYPEAEIVDQKKVR